MRVMSFCSSRTLRAEMTDRGWIPVASVIVGMVADLPSIFMAQCRSRHGRADSGRWGMLPNDVAGVLDGHPGPHRYARTQCVGEHFPHGTAQQPERPKYFR